MRLKKGLLHDPNFDLEHVTRLAAKSFEYNKIPYDMIEEDMI